MSPAAWILARWYEFCYRTKRFSRAFTVPRRALTLDIGSGDSPFAPADVICEKFPWDDSERTAGFQHDRPLVVGDIEALPFRDKAFDFIHCCHVLEHTFHPDRAIQELMRVGRAGYIEMPTAYFEKAFRSFAGHLWFVRQEDGRIVFRPKPRGILDPDINALDEAALGHDPFYDLYRYGHMYDRLMVNLFWRDRIAYRVEGQAVAQDDRSRDLFEKAVPEMQLDRRKPARNRTLGRLAKRVIRWWYSRGKAVRLAELLACPGCHGSLLPSGDRWHCAACRLAYPTRSGIPVLLKESAEPLGQPTTSRVG